jgi:putative hydroxymethylpyrimidine transport system substrate-binding protein
VPARANDPSLRSFLDAVERGAQYCVNEPDEAWKLFLKGRAQLDNELNRRAWRATLPRFAHSPAALDRARFRRFAQFLHAQNLIARVPPDESYMAEIG